MNTNMMIVICLVCLIQIDFEDLFTNWCSVGNHALLDELGQDFCILNRRVMIQ